MNNAETVKELANAIQILAESIQYTKLGDELSYGVRSELTDIINNMETLGEETEKALKGGNENE